MSESRQELFDLREDPDELHNLAGDPSAAQVERELRDRMLAWLVATNRPLNSRDLQFGLLKPYRTGETHPALA